MRIAIAVAVVVSWSSLAVAEPAKGNLRVAVACAESLATPAHGLVVRVDGEPLTPSAINVHVVYASQRGTTVPIPILDDIGYIASPGAHRVEIAAADCASTAFEATVDPQRAEMVDGRLAITNPALVGPTGAPNGGGLVLGTWLGHAPASAHDELGGMLSGTLERRHIALAADLMIAGVGATGSVFDSAVQARAGVRAASNLVAIAAGSGIGGELWSTAPAGFDGGMYVPLWAAVTVKPSCDVGLQLLAQYDVRPTSMSTSSAVVGIGLLLQPSDACRQPPGIHLHSS
jgi:hypothetical protein